MRQGRLQLVTDKACEPEPSRQRWRWLRREAISLGDVVVQIVAVVLGILLALFINNQVAARQQQKLVDDAVRSIRAELLANRAALHDSVAYLDRRTARMLASPANRNQPPRPCYLWKEWGGTGAVNLTDAAYQTAIATQALSHMPFEQAQRIAQVYGRQAIAQQAFTLIRSNILISTAHPLHLCVSAVQSFTANERNLSKAYAPIIGPDTAAWPSPSDAPATTTSNH